MALILEGSGFILRPFTQRDTDAFCKLNQDPEVMHYFPRHLSTDESKLMMRKINRGIRRHGFGLFALEDEILGFVGFVGCKKAIFEAPLNPSIEIAWRLAKASWGRGLATKAASVVLDHMFMRIQVAGISAFTAELNAPSYRVMERLGMRRVENFQHPNLDPAHRLCLHRAYFLDEKRWSTNTVGIPHS